MVRPLYIVGTERDVGKTTTSICLLHLLRQRGYRVGYLKPIGQHMSTFQGRVIHQDARVVANYFGADGVEQVDMAIPIPAGWVEHEVRDLRTGERLARIRAAYQAMASRHDVVIVEGMGNVARGACVGLSAAEICRALGAKALLVCGGGIGRALDDIALCATFLKAHGAELAGVVVNKVWPEKYDRVRAATVGRLRTMGLRPLGTVPYHAEMASPQMRQVHEHLGGQVLGGAQHLGHRVRNTLIAAMDTSHMLRSIQGSTLVISPGDRGDVIAACLRAHLLGGEGSPAVAGLVLTGDYPPEGDLPDRIRNFHLPVLAVKDDTFATAEKIVHTVFKIAPDDRERVELALSLAARHLDVEGILEALGGS